jgi:hypothetical protein
LQDPAGPRPYGRDSQRAPFSITVLCLKHLHSHTSGSTRCVRFGSLICVRYIGQMPYRGADNVLLISSAVWYLLFAYKLHGSGRLMRPFGALVLGCAVSFCALKMVRVVWSGGILSLGGFHVSELHKEMSSVYAGSAGVLQYYTLHFGRVCGDFLLLLF